MAEQNGKLVICDRCGALVFLKTTGDGEADGGWTRWNKFEPFPTGWSVLQTGINKNGYAESSRLCPKCSEEWEETMRAYMNEKTPYLDDDRETCGLLEED